MLSDCLTHPRSPAPNIIESKMEDRYQIIQRTAELPYGIQYEATDTLISRKAEIHRFAKPDGNGPKGWKKIFNERSGALTTLGHMGLPIIYDRGVDENGPYLIRQLVDEPTLESRLVQGPLNEYELWELAQQLLDIHGTGVAKDFFHGALSPDQICFATRPGGEKRYYILNFGLAELHNKINGTDEYFGSPCLVSLEQADGKAPTESSEIFSIGQLLYQCVAENHPFAANRVDEMAELHKNYPLAPIGLSREDIPKGMSDWLYRMTSTDEKERFATYADALHNLPGPVQTAPIPVIPTQTTTQQTAQLGQTTSVQQAVSTLTSTQAVNPQTGTQAVGFATTTQTVVAKAQGQDGQKGGGKKDGGIKALLQEPLILGGIALAVVLIIVGVLVFSGDDDSGKEKVAADTVVTEDSGSEDNGGNSKSETGLKKSLVAALNFNESLRAENDKKLKVEALGDSAYYRRGLYGQGLVLDKDHYYRLPLDGVLSKAKASSFTISFWVKSENKREPIFMSDRPWSGENTLKVTGYGNREFWQWAPDLSPETEGKSSMKDWNMVTLVFSAKDKLVLVYSNGSLIGSSSSDSIRTLDEENYLYIGCNNRKEFNFSSPAVIDQLYVWNRKLSSKEIRGMYKDDFSF